MMIDKILDILWMLVVMFFGDAGEDVGADVGDDVGGDVVDHLCEDPVEPLQGPVQVKL